ncbi:UNVERIFIED_CONTAM: LINE-1 reverse transcriptase [Sesamum calycinum]|uniref:LINE-1 reverse transcriptase n=1 Tax=Sesamum calycinum TaxID=2727403 RepID=A0AAW2LSV5_9LAMI
MVVMFVAEGAKCCEPSTVVVWLEEVRKTKAWNTRKQDDPNFCFHFPQIHDSLTSKLCKTPSLEEIKDVVLNIDKDSVAGPDGFSSEFYQTCWEFIADDIAEAVTDFFRGTPMPRSFIATTITLIPKTESPQAWTDFRSISLCNVTNKIFTKLLYNRLVVFLPTLISPSQSRFVLGRLIGDNILIA